MAAGSGSGSRSGTWGAPSRRPSARAISLLACSAPVRRCREWWRVCSTPDRRDPLRIGLFWLDAHPDFNTPETTRSGSLGGMPVAVATGRCLTRMRLDAGLEPPLSDRHVVMGGVRLTDPLEQRMLDDSLIEHVSVDDLRKNSPAIARQLDRLSRLTDKIYVHIDMDVLDPREVMGHGNKVPDGPSSEQLAAVFETIFSRYPKASAIGFATIPAKDEGGLSLAAVNRMIVGAVTGLKKRTTGLGARGQRPGAGRYSP
jgi:arginase